MNWGNDIWEEIESQTRIKAEVRSLEEFKDELRKKGANNSQIESKLVELCYDVITEDADLPFKLMAEKLVDVTKAIDSELLVLQSASVEVEELSKSISQIKTPTDSLESTNAKDMLTMFSYIMQLGKDYKANPDVTMRCASYAAWALCNTGVPMPKELNEEIAKKEVKK